MPGGEAEWLAVVSLVDQVGGLAPGGPLGMLQSITYRGLFQDTSPHRLLKGFLAHTPTPSTHRLPLAAEGPEQTPNALPPTGLCQTGMACVLVSSALG